MSVHWKWEHQRQSLFLTLELDVVVVSTPITRMEQGNLVEVLDRDFTCEYIGS